MLSLKKAGYEDRDYDSTYMAKVVSFETVEYRFQGTGGRVFRNLLFNQQIARALMWEDEKVLDDVDGYACTTM